MLKITIEGRTKTVSAWVTNEIQTGQLILGSGVLEDLNLQLYDIPDILSLSGHAEDTIKDPRASSPVTRVLKLRVPSLDISQPQSHPPNAFLILFKHGFHRETGGCWRMEGSLLPYSGRGKNKRQKGLRPAHQKPQQLYRGKLHLSANRTPNHRPTQQIPVHPPRRPESPLKISRHPTGVIPVHR